MVSVAPSSGSSSDLRTRVVTLELINTSSSPLWVYGHLVDTDKGSLRPIGNSLVWLAECDEWRALSKSGERMRFDDFALFERQAFSLDPGERITFTVRASPTSAGLRFRQTVFVSDFVGLSEAREIVSDPFVLP